uniref:Uncharacterized protein n=1 Tax=Anguilla anguilla TaxID=7936 RepID=A0A0E9QGN1_ANGAN
MSVTNRIWLWFNPQPSGSQTQSCGSDTVYAGLRSNHKRSPEF